jgi:hypothetical protein
MSKRKPNVTKSLLDAAVASYFAAIEIHNKPRIAYRYPSTTLLLMDAWELVLKAYIYKHINKKQIWENKKIGKTITFSKAIVKVCADINGKSGTKSFESIKSNLFLLEDYRNQFAHFFEPELDPIIFMLISKATINFCDFVAKWFQKDVLQDENLILLPIGFKLPFDPVEFLKKNIVSEVASQYVAQVLTQIKVLNDGDITDSIVVGFDISLASVKKVDNADLIAAIDSANPEATALVREVRITSNPSAPEVRITEDDWKSKFPYTYSVLREKIKEAVPNACFGKEFNTLMSLVKQNKEQCHPRFLDPDKPKGTKKDFYSQTAVDAMIQALNRNP